MARCTALSALAVFAYTELSDSSPHPAVEYAFDVILLALQVIFTTWRSYLFLLNLIWYIIFLHFQFKQKSICFIACDLLFALSDHTTALLEKFPRVSPKVVRFIAHTLGALGTNAGSLGPVLALILGEWTMRIPIPLLLSENIPEPLLLTILTVG